MFKKFITEFTNKYFKRRGIKNKTRQVLAGRFALMVYALIL